MGNTIKHFKTIVKHRHIVAHYCFMCHEYWRGITHDLSKFSLIEFSEGVNYYSDGKKSPVHLAKKKNGYSKAWLHHKGCNDHHYQYWTDDFDNGGAPLQMPYSAAVEMVCDYIGAAKTYDPDNFSFQKELEWWENKVNPYNDIMMHTNTIQFVTIIFTALAELEKKYQKNTGKITALSDGWARKRVLNEKTLSKLYDAINRKDENTINEMSTTMAKI